MSLGVCSLTDPSWREQLYVFFLSISKADRIQSHSLHRGGTVNILQAEAVFLLWDKSTLGVAKHRDGKAWVRHPDTRLPAGLLMRWASKMPHCFNCYQQLQHPEQPSRALSVPPLSLALLLASFTPASRHACCIARSRCLSRSQFAILSNVESPFCAVEIKLMQRAKLEPSLLSF